MMAFKCFIICFLTQVYDIDADPLITNNSLEVSNKDDSSLYRLPKTVRPISYNITLLTNVTRGDFTYKGIVIIDLKVLQITKKIVLHAEKLKINERKSDLKKEITAEVLRKVFIHSQIYDNETQFYKIIFTNALTPGTYRLTIHFDGAVHDDLFGFYRSSYKKDNSVKWTAVTQFSPTFARRAFPCMDEPGFKATFQLNIGHYSNETVTSNTFVESKQLIFKDKTLGNYYITHFARTPLMSTYLVGWAVHDFDRVNSTKSHMWLWTHLQSINSTTSAILMEGPLIEAALETYTAMSNPVRKIEQVAIPDFYYLAMENWGMLTYREAVGLINYDSTPLQTIFDQLTTLAHEYSHSYFGNLVTPSFWDFAWLKEAFATYFGYLCLGKLHEDWPVWDIFAVLELQYALLADSGTQSKRTMNRRGVGSADSVMATLDTITYSKGASILRMFADVLGEKPFRRAMHSYLKHWKYVSVTPENLYAELELVANDLPASVGELFDSWANQTNYPLVQATYHKNHVTLSQRSFDFSGTATAKRWWVPITLLTPTLKSKLHWLPASNESLTVKLLRKESWFVVNPRLSGYYRVDYDNKSWEALIEFLKTGSLERLPSVSRAALVDDAFNLARANFRNYSLFLTVADYLKRERDYVPWLSASQIISLLDDNFRDRSNTQKAFRRYVVKLITPIYEELTTVEKPYDSFVQKMHRELILSIACSIDYEPCTTAAKSTFDRWIANDIERVPKHFKSSVYRIGVNYGDDQDWENLWDRFLKTDSYVDKVIMIDGLASTENPSSINRYLEFAIQPQSDIVKQYRLTIVRSVMKKNMTTCLRYMQDNVLKIRSLRGTAFLDSILYAFGGKITTARQKQQFITFLDNNSEILGPSLNSGKYALKTADDNIKWIDRSAAEVQEYIHNN